MNKTILITGAGSGIGKDTALELARRGHRVIATTHTQAQADDLSQEAGRYNLELETLKLDIAIPQDREIINSYPDIDVLINNAAIGESGSLADIDMDIIRKSFEVNVISSFALTQLALANMIRRGSGTIIFISSTAGRVMVPFLAPYAMTKFAISGGAEALRKEVQVLNKNVYISVVEPGAYHTGFNQRMIDSQFLRMNTASYFYPIQQIIRDRLHSMFKLIEVPSTPSIVRAIIRATESKKPHFRYVAPWWQAVGVRLLRVLGK